ncbi:metallophosphoesterase [Paenibacillus lemnae]|uniref:LTD domain-containing protein n=1 Tax=Paenibacillus lemnae TaxID=1330551 RepID=A0A848M4L2_PAELE|nr:metallophosphoesterase [Paenibacillus lemnae]NMO96018.1 hypothetical protein [Paenibacillus lemnae]
MFKSVQYRFMSCLLILSLVLCGALGSGYGQASAQSSPTISSQNMPELLITELVPDSTNVGTGDGYEFIEVYNNTDQVIDFSNYKIRYRYLESDTLWAHNPNEVDIQPGGTLVFWIINNQNKNSTVADFNANYNTNLVENEDIVKIEAGGMSNSRMRELVVVTNTGRPIVSAFYNDGEVHNETDLGIFYKFPVDGSLKMQKISFLEHTATPGSLQHSEVPAKPVQIDTTPEPSVTNLTVETEIAPGDSLEVAAEAQDQRMVTSLALSYRVDDDEDFTIVQLQEEDGKYRYTIPYLELLGHQTLEYYFTASNTFKSVESPTFQVEIKGSQKSPRLNLTQEQILTGTVHVRGAANDMPAEDLALFIDGNQVEGSIGLEHPAYFIFEGNGIDDGINTLTIGRDILYQTDSDIDGYPTLAAPIEPQWLTGGNNTITFRSGDNDKTYFEDDLPEGNMDDFDIRNVRLLLNDGTEIRDPRYSDPEKIFTIGDTGKTPRLMEFEFDISVDKPNAVSYTWDTTQAADGEHTIQVKDGKGGEDSVVIQVDNQGPEITTTLDDSSSTSRTYKGSFTIEASASDAISGVERLDVKLDGEAIEVPYETSSAALSPGSHLLEVIAVDRAGNRTEHTVTFVTPEENPDAPVLVSPGVNGGPIAGLVPNLKVKVTDPTDDELTVSFHQAYRYHSLSGDRVKVSRNASDEEPPKDRYPAGETELTKTELELISESNDQYVTLDSTSQFPYLRFEVELEDTVESGDQVEVIWEGHTVSGRKVTMYAWNHTTGKWTEITKHIAASEQDFTLRGNLNTSEYVQDNIIDVIVQDEIPNRGDYDYSFVWVTDTQFLTELYPHIQQEQFEWIVNNKEELNIQYLFHTGDLVNDPGAVYQWERADAYMKMIEEANIPNGVLAGNHDVGSYDWDYTTYSQYFGEDRYKDQSYYGESYKDNRGHYDLISIEGNDYIMMYMGWGVEEEDIEWMNDVLAEYPDRIAFLSFHDYLLSNGTRSKAGNELYEKVVVPNANVAVVLSGHYTGANLLEDQLDDNGDGAVDRTVYQMLADYQGHAEGGSGYLRLFHVDQESGQIYVNTYSPYLDKYNYYTKPGIDEFTISLDLAPALKRVATDSIQVNHLKGEAIGTERVKSGETAAVKWHKLERNQWYSWYVKVKDDFGGSTMSEVWSFKSTGGAPAK